MFRLFGIGGLRVIGSYGQLAPSVEPVLVTCRRDAVNQIGRLRITSTLGYGKPLAPEGHRAKKAIDQEALAALVETEASRYGTGGRSRRLGASVRG